eukprot:g12250.t1
MVDQNVQDAIDAAMAAHQPALEQIARARLHQEMTGSGIASDTQRDHLLKKNEDLEEGCTEQQYLALSRVMEASDIRKAFGTTQISAMGWTPFAFIAALYVVGCITLEAAKGYQKFVNKAILGSIDPTVKRGPLPADTVFTAFWETTRLILGGDYLSTLTRNGGESSSKFYQRRAAATFGSLFVLKLDLALEKIRITEEFAFKHLQAQLTPLVSASNSGPAPSGRAARRARLRPAPYGNNNQTLAPAAPAAAPAAQRRPATSRKSPFRTAAERKVCPGYVGGSCAVVAKGGPKMQSPPAVPDFREEVLIDFRRSYGAGSVLPDCVNLAIDFNKENSCESIIYKNKLKAKLMLRLRADLAVEEALEHLSLPSHCREVYHNKNFLWMERLTKWALEPCLDIKDRKEEVLSFFGKMKKGLVTTGEIKPSGFWRLLPEADFLLKILEAEREAEKKPSRRPEDHWASEEQIKEMNRQTEIMLAKGLWEAVDISTAPKPIKASKCFPVEQGRARLCVDYRRQNLLLYNSEKMRMLGTRACQEITGRLMSHYKHQPALKQFKSDLRADVAAERANRDRTRAAAVAEVKERARVDLDFIKAMPSYRADRRDHTLTGDDPYGFVPFSSTKDMSGYYYQYCVDNPSQNLLWMPLPRGWDEAGPKRAMHNLPLAPILVQLGIAYELSADARCLSLSIDPSRIDKLFEKGKDVIASFLPPKRVNREALDSFKGLFRHCTQLSPQFNHLVRPLDRWSGEAFFVAHIKDEKQRRSLKNTLVLLLTCVPFAQNMEMRAADYELPLVHIYTDASLDNVRGLSAALSAA